MDQTWTPPAFLTPLPDEENLDWMTRSADAAAGASPPRPGRKPRRKLDLGPERPLPAVVVPETPPQLFDQDPWADTQDFEALRREQDALARRHGRVPPSQAFATVLDTSAVKRMEVAMREIKAKWPGLPVVVLYAKSLDPDFGALQKLYWRCHGTKGIDWRTGDVDFRSARDSGVLRGAVMDIHKKIWDVSLDLAHGEAAFVTVPVDLHFHEGPTPAGHFIVELNDKAELADEWVMKRGTSVTAHRLALVFLQENVRGFQVLRFGPVPRQEEEQLELESKLPATIGNHIEERVIEVRLVHGFVHKIWVGRDNTVHWRNEHHPLSSLPIDERHHTRRGDDHLFEELTQLDADAFGPAKPPERDLADAGPEYLQKTLSNGSHLYASLEDAPTLTAALRALVPRNGRAPVDTLVRVQTSDGIIKRKKKLAPSKKK